MKAILILEHTTELLTEVEEIYRNTKVKFRQPVFRSKSLDCTSADQVPAMSLGLCLAFGEQMTCLVRSNPTVTSSVSSFQILPRGLSPHS